MARTTHALAAAAVLAAPAVLAGPASAAEPEAYCFAKHLVSASGWEGTYAPVAADGSCDATNGLPMSSELTSAPVATGNVWHITIRWTFSDGAGGLAFETEQSGVLRLGDGDVVLAGQVTAGDHLGAQTHDEGLATGGGSYVGVMRVMPGS